MPFKLVSSNKTKIFYCKKCKKPTNVIYFNVSDKEYWCEDCVTETIRNESIEVDELYNWYRGE